MVEFTSSPRSLLRRTTLTAVGLAIGTAVMGPAPALARHHHHHAYAHRARVVAYHAYGRGRGPHFHVVRMVRSIGAPPPFSAYAVDGNSGRVLYGRDENAPRHPASITKVMTLYLLFEQIERGHLSLDSRIGVSEHAASQSPTKLGLRPGSTIRVEDAIKAIVTKSANDMAVAVAERIGGDEDSFARLMTRKAHALGMARTNFVNASGLPDDRQLTTARDLVTLGRAIHDHYPRYFRYFSTPSFRYAGQFMPNHNHLMGQVEGMDGIKTGYTRASGFNLLSSVNRDGHWLVAVVLGGRTRLGRDRVMADLIEAQIDHCATSRTAPVIAENPDLERVADAGPAVMPAGDGGTSVDGADNDSVEDQPMPPERAEAAPVPRASRAMPSITPAELDRPIPQIQVKTTSLDAPRPIPRPRPAFVSGVPRTAERDMTTTGSIPGRADRLDGSTMHYVGLATATPSTLKRRPQRDRGDTPKIAAAPLRLASLDSDSPTPTVRPALARKGTLIQIGATPTIEQANELIARAKLDGGAALAGARPFTEKVAKGGVTLFRARFAGLEPAAADGACKALRHAGLACFTTRN